MKTVEFTGLGHTKTYQGGEIKTPIEAGTVVEVSDAEAVRLLSDFKGLGIGKRDAFRLVELEVVEPDPPAPKPKVSKKADQTGQ